MGLLNLLLAKHFALLSTPPTMTVVRHTACIHTFTDKVQTAKEEQSQPTIPPFIVPAAATQTFLAAMLVYKFHPAIPVRHLLFYILYPTCPTYLILANRFHQLLYKRHSSDNSAAKNEEEKKEDATEQREDPKTLLKKEKSVCLADAKDDSIRWPEPVEEKSIRCWNDLVYNLPDVSMDQLEGNASFDKEVVDSVMNSIMSDNYKRRNSMATMGSLFSEDSVSRGLGGFRRGSVESWGDLKDDEAIPAIMNVAVIGSVNAARARAA